MFISMPGSVLPPKMTFKRPKGAHVDTRGVLVVGDLCPDCGRPGTDYASGVLQCKPCNGGEEASLYSDAEVVWSPWWKLCTTCYVIADSRDYFVCGHAQPEKTS
jgi:hypothetical protein